MQLTRMLRRMKISKGLEVEIFVDAKPKKLSGEKMKKARGRDEEGEEEEEEEEDDDVEVGFWIRLWDHQVNKYRIRNIVSFSRLCFCLSGVRFSIFQFDFLT